jgi:alkylation response protein AidB-like acyl-CoA dehydrogenase
MPVEKMQRYAQLREAGQQLASVGERKQMLQEHACALEAELNAMRETLDYLHQKISLYDNMEHQLKQRETENERTLRQGMGKAEGG